jgi:hypothetical protein
MKVYFNASLLGKEKYLKDYKSTIKIIHDLGHTAYADHVMNRNHKEIQKYSADQHSKDFQKIRKMIEKSDIMIIEATYPSIGVGHTLAMALQMYKNVLVLYRSPETPHGLLVGDPDRLLSVKKYDPNNIESLKNILESFLKKVQKRLLKIRLNLMIDKEQEEYLDLVSQTKGVSKSDFIRQLIDRSSNGNL